MRLFDNLHTYQKRFPGKVLFQYKAKGTWHDIPVEEFIATSRQLSKALYAAGIRKDDKVGIISNNRPEWNMVDYACQYLGAVTVPIYSTLLEEDIAYIFQDAGVKMVFGSGDELCAPIFHRNERIQRSVLIRPIHHLRILARFFTDGFGCFRCHHR
jgi:long-chain acyl-CoA synthetase